LIPQNHCQHVELINEVLASLVAVVAQSPQMLLGLINCYLDIAHNHNLTCQKAIRINFAKN